MSAQRISPNSAADAGEVASSPLKDVTNEATAGLASTTTAPVVHKPTKVVANAPAAGDEQSVARDLLAEVSRTWTAGKSNRQTDAGTKALSNALQHGLKPCQIAKHVVHQLNAPYEDERVKQCCYNITKAFKLARNVATAEQKAADEHANSSSSTATLKSSVPTDLYELLSVGIPYQRNGIVYSQGDELNKKRKATATEETTTVKGAKAKNKQSSVESAKQERHWMEMWKDAKTELAKLRKELKNETDDEVLAELKSDIACLRKKKDEWATRLGMKE